MHSAEAAFQEFVRNLRQLVRFDQLAILWVEDDEPNCPVVLFVQAVQLFSLVGSGAKKMSIRQRIRRGTEQVI